MELTKEQILLVHAAVKAPPDSCDCWRQWLARVDIEQEHIDALSYQVLPLVYHNLSRWSLEFPWKDKLKGIYRRAWLENQLLFQQISPLLQQFHLRGIPVLVPDDLTSILRLYHHRGARRLGALALVVSPKAIPAALDILYEMGMIAKSKYPERYLRADFSLDFWSKYNLSLTLAWHLFPTLPEKRLIEGFWGNADGISFCNNFVFTPELEVHFLRSCLRALQAKAEQRLPALVDVLWMIENEDIRLNWDRVLELSQLYRLTLPLKETLHQVESIFDIHTAEHLLKRLSGQLVSRMDRWENRLIYRFAPNRNLLERMARRMLLYCKSPQLPDRLVFPRYLQFLWGGERLLSLPHLVWQRFRGVLTPSNRN